MPKTVYNTTTTRQTVTDRKTINPTPPLAPKLPALPAKHFSLKQCHNGLWEVYAIVHFDVATEMADLYHVNC